MKLKKATQQDIDAAGDAMSVLTEIGSGHYPSREGDDCEDWRFDPDNTDHLRRFYELMKSTLEASPDWPTAVIGGMCYVILYKKNKIVDPDADTLELHPRFAAERNELLSALTDAIELITVLMPGGGATLDKCVAARDKATGGAA